MNIKMPQNIFGNMKLRTKLLISYLFVVMLPVVLVGYFLVNRTTETVLDQTDYINKINFQQIKKNIYNQMNYYLELSDTLMLETILNDYIDRNYDLNTPFFDKYQDYLRIIGTYTGILKVKVSERAKVAVYTTNDTIITDGDFIYKIDNEYIKNHQWCKEAIAAGGANIIYSPYLNENGKWVFAVCRNLTQSRSYTSIIKIEILESEIYKLFENEGQNKEIFLLNDNNFIVSSTEKDLIGKNSVGVEALKWLDFSKYKNFTKLETDNKANVIFFDYIKEKKIFNNWKLISITSTESLLRNINEIVKYSLFICLISVLIAIIFVVMFSNTLTRKIRRLAKSMGRIKSGKFDITVDDSGGDEIAELSKSFKSMVSRIDHLINQVYKTEMQLKDLEIEKKQAEICALQSQINPHFLFNTMESVRMDLWQKGEFEISEVIMRFSAILRKSIEWSDEKNTIGQEIQLLEDYLEIQKYRYMNKLDYKIYADEEVRGYCIPKFILQPIVENSIYHGIEMKKGGGCVEVMVQPLEGDIKITVRDNGKGMTEERLRAVKEMMCGDGKKDHKARVGIRNVHQRLKLEFGGKYGLTIDSMENSGTLVEVLIPGIMPLRNMGEQLEEITFVETL